MLFTPAYAQAAGAPPGPDLIGMLIPFIFIIAIMYFLVIRPQQRRMREHQEMINSVRRGDEVITAGGVYGKVTRVKEGDEEIEIEIGRAGSEPVRARVVKGTLSAVVSKTAVAGSGKKADAKAAKSESRREANDDDGDDAGAADSKGA